MRRPCQLIAIFNAAACVSAVSAFRVHFLTLFDNYPIFQRAHLTFFYKTLKVRPPLFPLFPDGVLIQLAVRKTLFAALLVSLRVQSYKHITNPPNNFGKIFCKIANL